MSTRHGLRRGIDLMVDAALIEYETPVVTGDWRSDIVAEHLHRVRYLRSRPWIVDAVQERPPIGPAAIRLLEHTLEQLRNHPCSGRTKLEAVGVLSRPLTQHSSAWRASAQWRRRRVPAQFAVRPAGRRAAG